MARRLVTAVSLASLVVMLMASVAMAGEVTGNGKNKQLEDRGNWGTGLHARSECAFSGQEDLQYFSGEGGNTDPHPITRGEPGHAQSWGQIPKEVRDNPEIFGGLNPGTFCNPIKGGGGGGEN
jgi:hypothetical protein